ncbi:conserved hypothetical protein [Deferribacter desulfuricans SSM1]|uniref:Polymerase/histidinol phosphatase N-terminal domain-containing protein n=1 Tax=Deferribacter desulfuricans (strain DSM 14783 / JCM 11476 / NBRC 101012 / SSM1) TaxID=639282 RepID=D3PCD8_DEFDS|nr:PHP domain-containing protein [Deferribacter desulfuricans]BAI80261.1 conserved hypothetical protein [Deferribacter desulfuricans SSM1]
MLIDLHIHTNFSSDGEFSPLEIYKEIKKRGVSLFSITDHNSIDGVLDLYSKVDIADNISFIPGVEFSCKFKGEEIHLLVYNFPLNDERVTYLIDKFKELKIEQAVKRVYKLKELGFKVDVEEVLKESNEKGISGVTFLNVLKKYPENREKLFDYLEGDKSDSPYTNFYFDFFRKGGYAYVDADLLDYIETVNLLKDEVLVIAHPGLYPKSMIKDLIIDGIKGVEVYSSYHNDKFQNEFLLFAEENNLVATIGSDFHGPNIKPDVDFINFELETNKQQKIKNLLKIL